MTWLVYLLLLSSPLSTLLLPSVSAKVFVSIDCGSLSSYTDENSIEWVGDDLYMKNGENHDVVVPQELDFLNISRAMTTLRVFTTRKKNCYSIEADKDSERVLVRARFFYGNYDKKATPPMFDLHFNGNLWGHVRTFMYREVYYETVYSLKGMNTISVCLAQTEPDNLPFISSLEVRSLDTGVYGHIDSNYPLYFIQRIAFGANKTIRFPDDEYDRNWVPFRGDSYPKVTSDSPSLAIDLEDNPPKSVLGAAITATNSSSSIFLSADYSSRSGPVHVNAYFSEVSKLNSTQNRSFQIFVNDQLLKHNGPVIPPYGSAIEVRIPNVTTSNNTSFQFVPTSNSTLPPLINAMEIFLVGDKLVEGTNSKDVNALAMLQKSFVQLQDWRGDPCLPFPYTWDWVACTDDPDTPRITALHLGNFGLVGTLPDFSDMDALQSIDLHNNSLAQDFPDFLGSFPLLEELNLADNNFSGTVPSSLSKNKNLKLNVLGNPHLCLSDESCDNKTEPSSKGRPSSTTPPQSSGNSKLMSTYMLPTILGTVNLILLDSFWVIAF